MNHCVFLSPEIAVHCAPPPLTRMNLHPVGTCSNTAASLCEYRCDPGYTMEGGETTSMLECVAPYGSCDGDWLPELPECEGT